MVKSESDNWHFLARAISGQAANFANLDAEQLLSLAARNGVAPLLHHLLCQSVSKAGMADGYAPKLAQNPRPASTTPVTAATSTGTTAYANKPQLSTRPPALLTGATPLLIEGLRLLTHREVARDLAINAAATRLLSLLAEHGIPALLLKGTALAHLHYPASWLRTRTDIDVYLPVEAVAETERLLQAHGYQVTGLQANKSHIRQFHATVSHFGGEALWFDLHYGISNRNLFRDCLPFAASLASRQSVPALGPQAFAPGNAELLVHACVHRIAHGRNTDRDRLIWLFDIHLLWAALSCERPANAKADNSGPQATHGMRADPQSDCSPEVTQAHPQSDISLPQAAHGPDDQVAQFTRLALGAGLGTLCADALGRCREVFGNGASDVQLAALRAHAHQEPSAKLLRAGKIGWVLADLRAEPGLTAKWRLLRELLHNRLS